MSTSAKNLIERLYVKILHRNTVNNDIDSVEALVYLNEAIREVFRWFALNTPWFIIQRHTTSVAEGDSLVVTPLPLTDVRRVAINRKEIPQQGPMVPPCKKYKTWSIVGFDSITINDYVGNPNDSIYIEYIPAAIPELVEENPSNDMETDTSPYPQMVDDLLIEHAMISYKSERGMISGDVETMRSRWFGQISAMFSDSKPPISIGSYYQGYAPMGDML